jgi:hypothetical protein
MLYLSKTYLILGSVKMRALFFVGIASRAL